MWDREKIKIIPSFYVKLRVYFVEIMNSMGDT
jgi:hypothetical protein